MLNLLFLWFSADPVWPCCTHAWTPGVPAGVRRSDPGGCPPEPWGTWTCHNSQSGSWLLWPANINSNFFFIRIISLCNTLMNIHYLPNFAVSMWTCTLSMNALFHKYKYTVFHFCPTFVMLWYTSTLMYYQQGQSPINLHSPPASSPGWGTSSPPTPPSQAPSHL